MNTLDPMVSALIALCKAEGGEKFVADKAAVSAENLLQITKGVKLPSGNPRGVGPGLRAKITKAYPGWLTVLLSDSNKQLNQPIAITDKAQSATNGIATLGDCMAFLATYLSGLEMSDREKAMRDIGDLVKEPETHKKVTAAIEGRVGAAFAQSDRKAA